MLAILTRAARDRRVASDDPAIVEPASLSAVIPFGERGHVMGAQHDSVLRPAPAEHVRQRDVVLYKGWRRLVFIAGPIGTLALAFFIAATHGH